jgi:hypothetical protein
MTKFWAKYLEHRAQIRKVQSTNLHCLDFFPNLSFRQYNNISKIWEKRTTDTSQQKLPSKKEYNQMNREWKDDGVSVASTWVPINVMKRNSSSPSHRNNIIDKILLCNSSEGSDNEEEVIKTTKTGFIQPSPRLARWMESIEMEIYQLRDALKAN